jgi:hypothetical protein
MGWVAQPRFLADCSGVYSKLSIILLLVALSGCARDVANRYYGGPTYPAKDSREVEILWRAPARDYVVIADFQSRGETPEDIREKAAKIGADAVIISILGGHYSRAEEWAAADRYQNTYSRITGTAVKYK